MRILNENKLKRQIREKDTTELHETTFKSHLEWDFSAEVSVSAVVHQQVMRTYGRQSHAARISTLEARFTLLKHRSIPINMYFSTIAMSD